MTCEVRQYKLPEGADAEEKELWTQLKSCETELNRVGKITFEAQRIEREFIEKLVDLRISKGLTQKELAQKSGLTQQAVSFIEKCHRKPTLVNLIKYLLGLDINIIDCLKIKINR